jgi:four helix bundle protein
MQDLKERTKRFARACFRLSRSLPKSEEFLVMRRQLLRSASSVAANYRSACRAKSKADFIAKLSTVEEEADESALWLEMIADELADLKMPLPPELKLLTAEAGELVAIMVASKKTARGHQVAF